MPALKVIFQSHQPSRFIDNAAVLQMDILSFGWQRAHAEQLVNSMRNYFTRLNSNLISM
jgi:hypothetical protein